MEDKKNCKILKNSFLESLKEGITPLKLESFASIYWQCGGKEDFESAVANVLLKIDEVSEIIRMVPILINQSQNYSKFVFWAEQLFNKLSDQDKKAVSVPMIYWTFDDEYTLISDAEYEYRRENKKVTFIKGEKYARPAHLMDLRCYEKVIEMIFASGTEKVIFVGGY